MQAAGATGAIGLVLHASHAVVGPHIAIPCVVADATEALAPWMAGRAGSPRVGEFRLLATVLMGYAAAAGSGK